MHEQEVDLEVENITVLQTFWGRTIYGHEGQTSMDFWPYSVHAIDVLLKQKRPKGSTYHVQMFLIIFKLSEIAK